MSKRRCVPSACVPCRKRKSKCDGGTPICATCTAVYKTSCYYDTEGDSRRKPSIKRDRADSIERETGTDSRNAVDFVVESLRTLSDQNALNIMQRLRADEDVETISQSLKMNLALQGPPSGQVPEVELSSHVRKQILAKSGPSRAYGHTSGLGLVPEDESYGDDQPLKVDNGSGTWTTVSQDKELICHLLRLYFTWMHPFHSLLYEPVFWAKFESGDSSHCSSLLVNSICAFGCHFSDRPEARSDPANPRTAGDRFFAEAKRLLNEDHSPSITTVQALGVMSLRETSAGRDSNGFMYAGRCLRMATEMGIHLNWPCLHELQGSVDEIEERKTTLWGCFVLDTTWSISLGRICQLPRAAITIEKPSVSTGKSKDDPYWEPYSDSFDGTTKLPRQPNSFLTHISSISELANDLIYMFYAPRKRLTSKKILDCYSSYKRWYAALPQELRFDASSGAQPALPEVYVLHMFYHNCVLHLFRPLIRVDIRNSHVNPRDLCLGSASAISDLMNIYRRHYSLRYGNLQLTYMLLSTAIVHLLNINNPKSREHLIQGLRDLEALSICHHFGGRAFKIVMKLSEQWNIIIPDESLRYSRSVQEPTSVSPRIIPIPLAYPLSTTPHYPLSMDISPDGTSPITANANLFTSNQSGVSTNGSHDFPFAKSSSTSTQPSVRTGSSYSPISQSQSQTNSAGPKKSSIAIVGSTLNPNTDQVFWSPFGDQGLPITAPSIHASPMELSAMLGSINEWEQLYQDGFTLSDKAAPVTESDEI